MYINRGIDYTLFYKKFVDNLLVNAYTCISKSISKFAGRITVALRAGQCVFDMDFAIKRKALIIMLRKDTIYMIKTEWEPKIPSTNEIKRQMKKRQPHLAGSVRAALGKVIGSSESSMVLSKKCTKPKR